MRVLCTSTPMEAVVIPMLPIARALRERGHEVVIGVGPDVQARVEEAGFDPEVIGPSAMEAVMQAFGDPAVAGSDADATFAAAMFGGVFAPALLPELRRIADEFAPEAVLHSPVELAAPILATERGIPSVTYGFGQASRGTWCARRLNALPRCGRPPDWSRIPMPASISTATSIRARRACGSATRRRPVPCRPSDPRSRD